MYRLKTNWSADTQSKQDQRCSGHIHFLPSELFSLQGHYAFPGHLCHKGLWQQFNTLLILNFLAKYFSLIYFSLTLMKDFFTIPSSNAMRMLHFTRAPGIFMLHYIFTKYSTGGTNAVWDLVKAFPLQEKAQACANGKMNIPALHGPQKHPFIVLLTSFLSFIKPHKYIFLFFMQFSSHSLFFTLQGILTVPLWFPLASLSMFCHELSTSSATCTG